MNNYQVYGWHPSNRGFETLSIANDCNSLKDAEEAIRKSSKYGHQLYFIIKSNIGHSTKELIESIFIPDLNKSITIEKIKETFSE